ncbi:hypothetical protein EBZ39_15970 [bacterium]|nr:hypothetical protein [bacterium]
MQKNDKVVTVVDGKVRGAKVLEVFPDGDVLTDHKDYYGGYVRYQRQSVFTPSEWERAREAYGH